MCTYNLPGSTSRTVGVRRPAVRDTENNMAPMCDSAELSTAYHSRRMRQYAGETAAAAIAAELLLLLLLLDPVHASGRIYGSDVFV